MTTPSRPRLGPFESPPRFQPKAWLPWPPQAPCHQTSHLQSPTPGALALRGAPLLHRQRSSATDLCPRPCVLCSPLHLRLWWWMDPVLSLTKPALDVPGSIALRAAPFLRVTMDITATLSLSDLCYCRTPAARPRAAADRVHLHRWPTADFQLYLTTCCHPTAVASTPSRLPLPQCPSFLSSVPPSAPSTLTFAASSPFPITPFHTSCLTLAEPPSAAVSLLTLPPLRCLRGSSPSAVAPLLTLPPLLSAPLSPSPTSSAAVPLMTGTPPSQALPSCASVPASPASLPQCPCPLCLPAPVPLPPLTPCSSASAYSASLPQCPASSASLPQCPCLL